MFTQAEPVASQRSHWYAKLVGEPVHEPCVSVNIWPSHGMPEMAGRAVSVGTAGTVLVTFEYAGTLAPKPFVAVAPRRSVEPPSAAATR
jgi:hypothetical protein